MPFAGGKVGDPLRVALGNSAYNTFRKESRLAGPCGALTSSPRLAPVPSH
jgi:hypothetical protein